MIRRWTLPESIVLDLTLANPTMKALHTIYFSPNWGYSGVTPTRKSTILKLAFFVLLRAKDPQHHQKTICFTPGVLRENLGDLNRTDLDPFGIMKLLTFQLG